MEDAQFRNPHEILGGFDFAFNKKMDRRLVFEFRHGLFLTQRDDVVCLGSPGTGKSHVAQALGCALILQGHRVLYREVHVFLEELADAALAGLRRERLKKLAAISLLILDNLGMRKLPVTAAEYRLELIMRRYERVSTLLTSNRPVAPWASGTQAALSACEEPNSPDSMSVSKGSAPRARRPRHARGSRSPRDPTARHAGAPRRSRRASRGQPTRAVGAHDAAELDGRPPGSTAWP